MSAVVAESILNGERAVGLNVLVGLQANSRALGKKMAEELDKELFDIGLGVRDVNIMSINYPPEVQQMAEKVAAQSFITDTNKYVTVAAAEGMEKGGGVAGLGAEVAIRIELEETAEGVQVHSLTVTPTGEVEETRDAVEELLQHTLGVSPMWNVPGGENAP